MKKQLSIIILSGTLTFVTVACTDNVESVSASGNATNAMSKQNVTELKIIDSLVGEGSKVRNNHRVAVHYTGWLYDDNAADKKGKKFDSSFDRHRPFVFSLGNKDVIAGWEQGILGMKKGGKRTLIIPPELGYGSRGAGSSIPPNSALVFDIELLQAG